MSNTENSNYKVAHRALVNLAEGNYKSQEDAYRYVIVFADKFWFKNYTPSFDEFFDNEVYLKRVGYLVDFLSKFPHVTTKRKKKLKRELSNLKSLIVDTGYPNLHIKSVINKNEFNSDLKEDTKPTFYNEDKPDRFSYDEVAEKWGLYKGLHASILKELLNMQRRENLNKMNT